MPPASRRQNTLTTPIVALLSCSRTTCVVGMASRSCCSLLGCDALQGSAPNFGTPAPAPPAWSSFPSADVKAEETVVLPQPHDNPHDDDAIPTHKQPPKTPRTSDEAHWARPSSTRRTRRRPSALPPGLFDSPSRCGFSSLEGLDCDQPEGFSQELGKEILAGRLPFPKEWRALTTWSGISAASTFLWSRLLIPREEREGGGGGGV